MLKNEALPARPGMDELLVTVLTQELAAAASFDPGEDVVSDPDDFLWEKTPEKERGGERDPDRSGDRDPDASKSN